MKSIQTELADRIVKALQSIGLDGDPLVFPSQDSKFGDYQSNCAMGLGKKAARKPRELAEEIVSRLQIDDISEPPQIAGPGFINFRIKPAFLSAILADIPPGSDPERARLGIEAAASPEVVVVDLSSPNLAKEMHVGHLRSTVIGDCVARCLEFMGHTVHRDNHVGDWGTQFGMLVAHLRHVRPDVADNPSQLVIHDLETFYIEAKSRFDEDEEFKKESRETVVALQQADPQTRLIWKAFCDESLRHCHAIYDRLKVDLVDRGESFYADLMHEVVRRLEILRGEDDSPVRISDGALCVFLDGFTTRDGDPLPVIVRKADGGFNYASSDLATILHRVEQLGATRIIYVVGLPQKQHFEMVFAAARKVGWVSEDVSMVHLGFGSMLSATGKPFKTREGGTVKLKDLLDEAVAKARKVVESQLDDDKGGDRAFTKEEMDHIAETVGLAAVKYFDLSHSLAGDYKFDLSTMLSLEGNTAPYMLYAYARIRSIARKADVDFAGLPTDVGISLDHPAEVALALKLLQFGDTLGTVVRDYRLNLLTEYLFELAKTFSRFYDKKIGVRIVDASPESVRNSRLRLCDLTARTLKLGLHLLGIETLDRM